MQTEEIVGLIRQHHRDERFLLKSRIRIERSVEAFIAFNVLHYEPPKEKGGKTKAGKDAFAAAKEYIAAALADDSHEMHAMLLANELAKELFETQRKAREKEMIRLVKLLPIYPWAKAINGIGEFGLAQIIGECGDLANYATVSKLWKRLGLAVIEGHRQGSPGKGASSETWIEHGYKAARRSIVWNIGQSLFKAQSARTNKETGEITREAGPYRLIYDARKLYERPRVESDGHAHNRATRYMEKMLIADLWSAWRGANVCVTPITELPHAPSHAHAQVEVYA